MKQKALANHLQGEGHLFQALMREMKGSSPVEMPISDPVRASTDFDHSSITKLTAHDWYDAGRDLEIQRYARNSKVSWLPMVAEGSELLLGPWILPDGPGCIACTVERVVRMNPRNLALDGPIPEPLFPSYARHRNPFVSRGAASSLVSLLLIELENLHEGHELLLKNRILVWKLPSLEGELHSFFRLLGCAECGPHEKDSATSATMVVRPRRKAGKHEYRAKGAGSDLRRLSEKLVSPRFGLVRGLFPGETAIPAAAAPMPVGDPETMHTEWVAGRATSVADAKRTALLEALERYAGFAPNGKASALCTSARELGDLALDPRNLILHSPDQYAEDDFPFVPFDDEKIMNWVWGYSFRRRSPVALPESSVYYGHKHLRDTDSQVVPLLAFDTSNGCALGSSLEDALLYGLFEVLERDAFLMTWYTRTPPKRVDLHTADDPKLAFLAERMEGEGYEVYAFNITQEFMVPSIWVAAVCLEDSPGKVKTVSAAGCHIDPEKAAWAGLIEVAASIPSIRDRMVENRSRALAMLKSGNLVTAMPDHCMLYALYESFYRLQWAFHDPSGPYAFQSEFCSFYNRQQSSNLKEDLDAVVSSVLEHGLDVVAVDQTTPEQAELGLVAVRVFLPGALPMSFGHRYRRLHGAKRLEQRLGTTSRKRATSGHKSVNPWPHPFP